MRSKYEADEASTSLFNDGLHMHRRSPPWWHSFYFLALEPYIFLELEVATYACVLYVTSYEFDSVSVESRSNLRRVQYLL